MVAIASQITSLTIVYSTVYSDADQRKHQSSALLAFVRGIHRGPVNSPHKWPVTQKMFPFDDVIMWQLVEQLHLFCWECFHWPCDDTQFVENWDNPVNKICLTSTLSLSTWRGLGWNMKYHYSDVIMGVLVSEITGVSIVYSTVCSGAVAQIKENTKAPHQWPLWGEITDDRWIPHTPNGL